MAAFCAGCGSALGEGSRFCEKCGRAVPTVNPAVGASAPAPVTPAVASPPPSNTAIKAIFAVLAVVMFLGLLMAGSCFYVAYRVRQKARELSSSLGGDVPRYSGKRDPCALLTAAEAGQALGQTVNSVEQHGITGCEYHFGDNGQQLGVRFAWQGGAMTMKMTAATMKQLSSLTAFTPVTGVGDEAYLTPMNSELLMRKGDVLVTIELQSSGVSADAAKNIAGKIADRL